MVARDAEVLIVGGGPAGAATAFRLARAGVDVLVLDRARFPRDKPCAEYLSPQASRLLAEMGALERVERAGAAHLTGMRVTSPDGAVIHGEFAAARGFAGFRDRGLALRRLILDEILLGCARAAGARVVESATVRDLVRDGSGRVAGVTATVDGAPRTLHAPLIVGADGLRSVVARRLALARAGRMPRRYAVVAHYTGVGGMGSCGEMFVDAAGYAGLAPVDAGFVNVAVVVPAAGARAMRGAPDAFMERWIAARPVLQSRFGGAVCVGAPRVTGPFNTRVRRAWAPGVALVGDAAGFFDPFTGEGIHTALRSAELLTSYAFEAVRATTPARHAVALAAWDRALRHELRDKRRVERVIASVIAFPPLINHAARVLARHRDMADLLVGVTGDVVPPRAVLSPSFVLRLLLARGMPRTADSTDIHDTAHHLTQPSP